MFSLSGLDSDFALYSLITTTVTLTRERAMIRRSLISVKVQPYGMDDTFLFVGHLNGNGVFTHENAIFSLNDYLTKQNN